MPPRPLNAPLVYVSAITDPISIGVRAGEFWVMVAPPRAYNETPMRARGWWFAALIAVPIAAFAEPKPSVVEIKSFRDQLIVLRDAQGGTYVVLPGSDSRAWYGGAKTLYEQVVLTRTSK